MTPFAKTVVSTVAFSDAVGGIPFTKIELYAHSLSLSPNDKTLGFYEFLKLLEDEWEGISPYLFSYRGFYFLKKNTAGYRKRLCLGKSGVRKWRIAKTMARIISFLPYMRMIAITGSLALNNTNPKSDIDVLIVAKEGHIWTARMLVSVFMHILGKRRHGQKITDRICLNHYLSEASLALRPRHLFSAHIFASLIPLWHRNGIIEKLRTQNKPWTSLVFRNITAVPEPLHLYTLCHKPRIFYLLSQLLESLIDKTIGFSVEKIARAIQIQKIRLNPASKNLGGGQIIFDDHALVFHHPRPKEQEAMYLYEKNVRELKIRD